MRIGVVKEIKPGETRVALTPAGASALVSAGHSVLVEQAAGRAAGFDDDAYSNAGARVVAAAREVWAESELLIKVKEPVAPEYELLRPDMMLFAYLHLAANPGLVRALVDSGVTAIAYETVEDDDRGLPLLAPMSEVAGRLAAQAAAYFLQTPMGGPGLLIGGVPGVGPARVGVIGGGVAGTEAAQVAVGMGAEVTILERSPSRIRALVGSLGRSARVLFSDDHALLELLQSSDVVIGAVLVHGARTPCLVTRDMLALMRPETLLVDVAIDQGGCFETSRPTTHASPIFSEGGISHYCVSNMPAAVPRSATRALTNATFPYILRLADLGLDEAVASDPGFAKGLDARFGAIAGSQTVTIAARVGRRQPRDGPAPIPNPSRRVPVPSGSTPRRRDD